MDASKEHVIDALAGRGFRGSQAMEESDLPLVGGQTMSGSDYPYVWLHIAQQDNDLVHINFLAEGRTKLFVYREAVSEVMERLEVDYQHVNAYRDGNGDTFLLCSNEQTNEQLDAYARQYA